MQKSFIAVAVAAAILPIAVLADGNNIYGGVAAAGTPNVANPPESNSTANPYSGATTVPLPSGNLAQGDIGNINNAIVSADLLNQLSNPDEGAHLGDGWWFGAQGGPTMGNISLNQGFGNIAMPGGLLGARAGYGYTYINGLYLGAELEADYQNTRYSDSTQDFSLNNLLAFSILPGYHFSPDNMLYLKLGTGITHYQSTNNTSYEANKGLLITGVGYDTAIGSNTSLGLEYDYLWLPSTITPYSALPTRTQNISENLYLITLTYQLDTIDSSSSGQSALPLNGPYVGAELGPESIISSSNGVKLGGSGVSGSVHAGFGHTLYQWLYMAGEAWLTGHTATADTTYNSDQSNHTMAKESSSYGVAFIPGYAINPSRLIYGRIGPEWTNVSGIHSATDPTTYSDKAQGWQLGAGYETSLTQQLSLSLEYDYNWYNYTDVNSYKLSNNQVSIGLNYRW